MGLTVVSYVCDEKKNVAIFSRYAYMYVCAYTSTYIHTSHSDTTMVRTYIHHIVIPQWYVHTYIT